MSDDSEIENKKKIYFCKHNFRVFVGTLVVIIKGQRIVFSIHAVLKFDTKK